MSVKVAIISDDQRLTQRLVQMLGLLDVRVGEIVDRPREAYLKITSSEPRVILFVEPEEDESAEQIVKQMKKVNETAPILYFSKTNDFRKIRQLFREGVSDLLQLPDELEDLEKALEKTLDRLQKNLHKAEKEKSSLRKGAGTIISLYSGKGGTGTSLLSANLAHTLALDRSLNVLLVDLNLQFGAIHTLFNINHSRHIGDLKPVIRELTESQVKNVIYRMEESGLHILLSPNSPEEAEQFKSEEIEMLLNACRLYFDVIILDIPKELNEISISALNGSDHIFYVVHLERPAIVNMQSVLDLLERYHVIKDDNVSVIVNRFNKQHDISLTELQKMTRFPVLGTVADDFKLLQPYINLGQPWYTDPKVKVKKGPVKSLLDLKNSTLAVIGGE
ncbi:AAA family ATPase [Ammoniphilus sp. CFH 90114]|uniref:AAA family ATPase n=1 Tax=Ammoniphilus sp. CFH 90114 TaxID=2493665 RepID=UPI00100E6610|nr:AAA family ATPase [Ammoniphilus sp. CFH 90114]RXT07834.1 hypothetical protein EIZ39_10415 [Ammoniphilus sp. CFH 90114]